MRKKASCECRTAFYAAKSVGYGCKWKIEPEAKFLRRDKVVKMEIANRAVIVFMIVTGFAKMFGFLFKAVAMCTFRKMLVAESVKRLVGRCE